MSSPLLIPQIRDPSPKSLVSLPPELLIYLVSFLPPSSLPEFATVCSWIRDAAEFRLWEELDLTPKSIYKEPMDHIPFTSAEALRRRERCRKQVKDKIQKVLEAGSKRPKRFLAVSKISATTHRYANHHLVSLLHLVRDNLTSLRVHAAPRSIEFTRWGPHDGFYQKISDFDGTLPFLTELDLSPCHNVSYHHILRLLSLTPNLVTLKINARDELAEEPPLDPIDEPWLGLPVLKHLKEVHMLFPEDDGLPDICSVIFQKAPNLEKVMMGDIWADLEEDGWSDEEQGESTTQFSYFEDLKRLEKLVYMDWRCGSYHVLDRLAKQGGFDHLQVLIVDGNVSTEDAERIETVSIPALPAVQKLIYRSRHQTELDDIIQAAKGVSAPELCNQLVPLRVLQDLYVASSLTSIVFTRDIDLETTMMTQPEKWKELGMRGILFSTYRNHRHELTHIQTLTRSVPNPSRSDTIESMADDEDAYVVDAGSHWEHAVDFGGRAVSAETMDKAFQAGGLGNWRDSPPGRGMELPSASWEVLSLDVWGAAF